MKAAFYLTGILLISIPVWAQTSSRSKPVKTVNWTDEQDQTGGIDLLQKSTKEETKQKTNTTTKTQHVIVIDAGHGGKDPGCTGKNGTQEKTVVLSVAKKLKNKLDANGYKTYLTRSNDTFLKLADRAEFAEKKHADLFISLHANANPSRDMRGFSIYTLSEKASELIILR